VDEVDDFLIPLSAEDGVRQTSLLDSRREEEEVEASFVRRSRYAAVVLDRLSRVGWEGRLARMSLFTPKVDEEEDD
jgi:hypothetical protein